MEQVFNYPQKNVLKNRKVVKIIGYILLLLSNLVWALKYIIPWFDFSQSQIAWITPILIISSEIFFYVSVLLIGMGFSDKITEKMNLWIFKSPNTKEMIKKTGKKIRIIGYVLLLLSCLFWGLILVIPLFGFSKSQNAGITTTLIIASEILFYACIPFIGKSFFDKITNKLKFWKTKSQTNE